MAITPGSLAVAAGLELDGIFRDSLDVLGAGEAQYLVDGQPESVTGQISQAAGRSACRIYGTGSINLPPAAAARYERTCRPYLLNIDPNHLGAAIVPGGVGGQCVGMAYLITLSRTSATGVDLGNRVIDCVGGWFGPLGIGKVIPSPDVEWSQLTGFTATGLPRAANIIVGPPGARIAILSASNCIGFTPPCGSPPPQVVSPRGRPNPTPSPFTFNPSADIDVSIDTTLNVDGSITFNIGTGPITIDPFTDNPFDDGGGGGGDDPSGGGGGPPLTPPGDIGSPGSPGDTEDGGETEGEAPEGEVLVGLKIVILASRPKARQYSPGVFRGAGYIYMGVIDNLDQDYGGSMLKSGQFFFAEKENLTHWRVSANNGFNFRVTPYYREVPE